MRTALVLSLLGAALVFVGLGVLNPVFAALTDGAIVPLFELEAAELLVEGTDVPILRLLLLFAGVAAAGAGAGFAARVGRRVSVNLVLFAVAVIGVTFHVHVTGETLVTAAAGGSLRAGEVVTPVEGIVFLYLGGLLLLAGGLAVLVAVPPSYRRDPLLRAALRRPVRALPWDLVATTTASAVLQVAILLTALFLWQEQPVRAMRAPGEPAVRISALVRTPPPAPAAPFLDTGADEATSSQRGGGAAGVFGDPDVDPSLESRVPRRDGDRAARVDPRRVGLNDLLETSRLGGRDALSTILSPDAADVRNHLAVAMAGAGSELRVGHGTRGLSFRGTDTGGGGTGAYGRIHGLTPLDTGNGHGVRARRGDRHPRRVGAVEVGRGGTRGFCTRGDIARNVRLRAAAVRACYERQLQLRPRLAGKVTVRWTIGLDGAVNGATVARTTLRDAAVERCVLRAVRRIRFRKPEGGVCVVSWPFAFHPG